IGGVIVPEVAVDLWKVVNADRLTPDLIISLLKGEVGAVRIQNFLSEEACNKCLEAIKNNGVDYYEGVYPKIGKVGITQFEHRFSAEKKKEYFAKAKQANHVRESIFQASNDPVKEVVEAVQEGWEHPVTFAVEKGTNEQYFAGLIRVMNRALLHVDWAGGLDGLFPEWSIGEINAQLAWNIYLQPSNSGGSTIVYRRLWRKSDETFYKLQDSYAYSEEVVADSDFVRIIPQQGELVFFNPQHYHEVQMTEGDTDRITVSSFIGLMPDQRLVFWS
ncbi:hypothetical protein, partial [Halalkalibacterium halodurans]|uniref:2OG-Fe(II)-dependent halogenase WelO5 family protein n=1 Tax=Halalkalibacterium halodurans TaxID=86665 RepID=UPI0030EEC875